MLALLLALLVVAWLAKDALKSYGLMAPATTTVTTNAGTPAARAPAAADASGATVESAPPVPTAPVDRARGVGDMLKQQEGSRGGGH